MGAPLERILDSLIDPDRALGGPDLTAGPQPDATAAFAEARELAHTFHRAQNWADLATLYQRLADWAWKRRLRSTSIRLLLAERRLALRIGDDDRVRQATYFIAQRHRLSDSMLAAEWWDRVLLRTPLTEHTAGTHVAVWRELAAIAEVRPDYDLGLEYSDRAVAIYRRFADQSALATEHVKALLQRAVLQRQRGAVDLALQATQEARRIAAETDCDRLTRGLVELRDAGFQLVIGRPEAALDAYRRAEEFFAGVSDNNRLITLVRQVPCLRGLGRFTEALQVSARLLDELRPGPDDYRIGQVLLERAEVFHDMGDHDGVRRTLEAAARHYAHATGLEALRWHRHMARHLIETGGDPSRAARHLRTVLRHASAPGRRDLTRTMLALHDLTRLPQSARVPAELRLAAGRAALLAADLQRASLSEPAQRWALHALREEVYSAALLLHADRGDTEAVVQITETGRTDMLNQLLASGTPQRPGALTELPLLPHSPDPQVTERVFAVASALAEEAPPDAGALPLPGDPLPGHRLDRLADVVVMSHLAHNGTDWWASTATRPRGGEWTVVIQPASTAVADVLNRLASGELLAPQGIGVWTWEELGSFLLPHPDVWGGDRDAPRSVVICPDPRLWQLPHAALTRQGTHLAEVAEVTLAPSLRTLQLLHERSRRRADDAPSTDRPAVSVLDGRLSGHAVEIEALAAWPGGHRGLDDLGALDPDLGHGLLYLSGHGDGPGAGTVLGPTRVTLEALARLRLPPLVLLNGCWSGSAESRYGQDPLSLAVGGLLGGASTVIAGIGRIDGMASAHIAAALLGRVRDGAPAASALRAAQLGIRDAHPELGPFGWAGLCCVGIGR